MHLIAKEVAEFTSLPWIADFRDPWTHIDFYKDLMLTRFADRKHHKQELEVLKKASAVITIGSSMAEEFDSLYHRHYDVITNGYDEDDMTHGILQPDNKFSIAHIGTLVGTRNPVILWEAIRAILEQDSDFRNDLMIKLVGGVDFSVNNSIEQYGLSDHIERIDYMPHASVVKVQQQAQVLLLLINNTHNAKSILTGKFFEYLAAGRPILCIGPPDGDAGAILKETNSGLISDFTDLQKAIENILIYYKLYKEGKLTSFSQNIEKYSRTALTGKLAEVMNKVIKK
jgi:glycosyltransferase involved in cell wall biosynthesis